MYNIKLSDYVPKPQPATSDRIVAAHYYAAWKKGAAEIHGGFDDLHGYPEPDDYRVCIRRMKEMTDALPENAWGRKIMMIDNWNEWDEGHYVSPSHEFGFRYLQAIREELTARDNLPDYRTPQEIGLSERLNSSWEVPDLREVSLKRLDKDKVRAETLKKYI